MVQRELHHSAPSGRGADLAPPAGLATRNLARSNPAGAGRHSGGTRTPQADALYEMGLRSATRQSPDLVAAHKWFNLAAMHGMRQAKLERAELAQVMTAREIAEAQRQAREWLARH